MLKRRSGAFGRQARAGIGAASGVLVLAAALFLAVSPGIAYRFQTFYNTGPRTPTAAYAVHWDAADLPVRFRLLDNDLGESSSRRALRDVIEAAFATWNAVPTSGFRVELAGARYEADEVSPQGINEIGFSRRSGYLLVRVGRDESATVQECDIGLDADLLYDASDERERLQLQWALAHELGHCAGLEDSEPYPMTDGAAGVPPAYGPPPLMSSARTSPALSEDDRVGLSLLYPTPDFARSRGAVAGRVVDSNGLPARFVYVQALRPGGRPGAGPGAYANEDGYFVLEGLPPGYGLLWMHPAFAFAGYSHSRLHDPVPAAGAEAVQDQWRWVKVTAGETLVIPAIVARTGRGTAPP